MKNKHFFFEYILPRMLLFAFISGLTSWNTTSVFAQVKPIRLTDDILTFSGGQKDSVEDVYVINMGAYENSKTYVVTVNRPKGASANYSVSVEYTIVRGTLGDLNMTLENGIPPHGTLTFVAGETQKTISLTSTTADDYNNPMNSDTKGIVTLYIYFSYPVRTQPECPLIQLNFGLNGTPGAPVSSSKNDCYFGIIYAKNLMMGQYVFLRGNYDGGSCEITADQKFYISGTYIDRNADDVSVPDTNLAVKRSLGLHPRESGIIAGATFLHRLTEEEIISDGYSPSIELHFDSITNVKAYDSDNTFVYKPYPAYGYAYITVTTNTSNWEYSCYIPPRFGAFTTNKSEYQSGEAVVLTIPFLNAKLWQKVFCPQNPSDLLQYFKLTLDGGATFIGANQMSYDAQTGNITATFNAPENTGDTNITLFPEMQVTIPNNKIIYPVDAFTSFQVNSEIATAVYTDSLVVSGIPAQNRIFLNKQSSYQLTTQVFPANCTFLNPVWTSSNESVVKVDASGMLTALSPGKATIILNSPEVAFRQSHSLPANDTVLIKSYEITVYDIQPRLDQVTPPFGYNFEAHAVFYPILTSDWKISGPASVEVVHSDSQYAPITDSFVVDTLSRNYIKNQAFDYVVHFNSATFPQQPSTLGGEWGLNPVCTVNVSLPVTYTNGDTFVIKKDCPIYFYAPMPSIKASTPAIYVYGVDPISADFNIGQMMKDEFNIGYSITKNGQPAGADSWAFTSSNFPSWLNLNQVDSYFYDGTLTLPYTFSAPTGEKDDYNITVYAENTKSWEKYTFKRNFSVYSTASDRFVGTYTQGGITYDLDTQWQEKHGLDLSKVAALATNNDYGVALYDYITTGLKDTYPTEFRIKFPSVWGSPIMRVTGGTLSDPIERTPLSKLMPLENYQPFQMDFTYELYFPMDGQEYTMTISWPRVGISKEYKYRSDNLNDLKYKILPLQFSQNYTIADYSVPISLTYKNTDSTVVNKSITVSPNGFYCMYDPAGGFLNSGELSYRNAAGSIAGSVTTHPFAHDLLNLTSPSWNHLVYYTSYWSNYCSYTNRNFLYIQLVDINGNIINSNAEVNYDIYNFGLTIGAGSGSINTSTNGLYAIPTGNTYADNNNVFHIEVVAEGYMPQYFSISSGDLITDKSKSDAWRTLVLKKDMNLKDYYSGAKLWYNKPQALSGRDYMDLSGIPLNGNVSYISSTAPELNLAVSWSGDTTGVNPNQFMLSVNRASSLAPVSSEKISYEYFKNTYYSLRYDLTGFLTLGATTNPSIQYSDSLMAYLPGFTNTMGGVENDMNDNFKDFALQSPQVKDVPNQVSPSDGDMGDSKKAFQNFDITVPSALPFTFQVTRNGNEYTIKA